MLKDYEDFYRDGGFNYNQHTEKYKKWLFEKTSINSYNKDCTVLDVGCGDGFWSFLLASKFNVTGIDISKAGIDVANKKVTNLNIKNINFVCGNALEIEQKFDLIFCRGPSFLNLPPSDERFVENLKKMLSICNLGLIYIQSTKKPYGRWSKSSLFDERADSEYYNSRWYYHDPDELEKLFGKFGDAKVRDIDSYIVAEIHK